MKALSEIKLTSTHKEDLEEAIKYCIRFYRIIRKDCNKVIFSRDGVDVEIKEGMTSISLFHEFINKRGEERCF